MIRRALAYSDFVTVPLVMAGLAASILHGDHRPSAAALLVAFVAGALAWTFVEYWLHRALHARRLPALRRLHMRHHQHPAEPAGGTLWSSIIIVMLMIAAIAAPATAVVIEGFLGGYLVFILLHHAMHHGWERWLPPGLAAAHERHHHAGPERQFGVSTGLWDHVFGTAGR